MKLFVYSMLLLFSIAGCSATWSGVKEDTTSALDWTKGKVNQGASYVKEKTQ
ncbi:hypothetical protein [Sulfuricurvum sp. PD_MW2]|jgi:hypothetical protein|uniref:hypothetical protein n=1 Tax=Sulfuricurvum sp. PD_MW2 TaxID=2027917 RepID=UPI0025E7F9E2|nr:hypothetical protein [Sulfuricurvum sp. PD_MW2]